MHQNKNYFAMRNMFISTIATFVTIITIALFASLFLNFAGILFGAFSDSAHAATYSASITAPSIVKLGVSSSGNGANVTSSDIGIISTCPSGYTVSIAASSTTNDNFSDTTLYKDGDKTNTVGTKKISPSAGTLSTPASILGTNNKTWGYTTEAINNNSPVTTGSNFVGLTTTQTVLTNSATGTSAAGTTLPVYYGVSIDSTIEPGEYKMTDDAVISYYLTTSLDCTSYQVAFNPTSTAGGTTLTGTGTMGNQRISENTPTNLDTNTFTAPEGYEFKEWNTAQDGTGTSYTNGQSVTDLTTVGGTITLYAQWKTLCTPGNICYDDNGANSPTKMGEQIVSNDDTEILLWASNYQRSNYGFAGWNTKADGTGANFGPNETIKDSALLTEMKTDGLKLYARWIPSAGNLQNWTGCKLMAIGDLTALTDTRDNSTYAVAKLADDSCWMIENLRLSNQTAAGAAITINAANTDHPADTFSNLGVSIDPSESAWCSTDNSACLDQSAIFTGNTTNPTPNMTSSDNTVSVYSYGNYYNWYSATAGTGTYSMSTNDSNAAGSICPAGWRLPTGGDNDATYNEYRTLGVEVVGAEPNDPWMPNSARYYNIDDGTQGTDASALLRKWPNNFVYSGTIYDSSLDGRGNDSYYWASTVRNDNESYRLRVGEVVVDPGTSFGRKRYGRTVRCKIREEST